MGADTMLVVMLTVVVVVDKWAQSSKKEGIARPSSLMAIQKGYIIDLLRHHHQSNSYCDLAPA